MNAYFDTTEHPIYFDDNFDFHLCRDKWGQRGYFHVKDDSAGITGTNGTIHIDYIEKQFGQDAPVVFEAATTITKKEVVLWKGEDDSTSLVKFYFADAAEYKKKVIGTNYNLLTQDFVTFDEDTLNSGSPYTWAEIFADMPVDFDLSGVTTPAWEPVNVNLQGMTIYDFVNWAELRFGLFFVYDSVNTKFVATIPSAQNASNTTLLAASVMTCLNMDGQYNRLDLDYSFYMPQENDGFIGDLKFLFNKNVVENDKYTIDQSLGTFGGAEAQLFNPWIVAEYDIDAEFGGTVQNDTEINNYVADVVPRLAALFNPPIDYKIYGRLIDFEVDGSLQKIIIKVHNGVPYTEIITDPYKRDHIDRNIQATNTKGGSLDIQEIYKRPFIFGKVQTAIHGNESIVSVKRCDSEGTLLDEYPDAVYVLLRSTSIMVPQITDLFVDDVIIWVAWDNLLTEAVLSEREDLAAGILIGSPNNFKADNAPDPWDNAAATTSSVWVVESQASDEFGIITRSLSDIAWGASAMVKHFVWHIYDSEGKLVAVQESSSNYAWPDNTGAASAGTAHTHPITWPTTTD